MCTPPEAEVMISGLNESRIEQGILQRPSILWEPQPISCVSTNLDACLRAAKMVDVFSPNDVELAYLYGLDGTNNDKALLEELAYKVLKLGIGKDNDGLLVPRAGAQGCLIASAHIHPSWVPAFVKSPNPESASHDEVVDPTGCGNVFLGGFAYGLAKTGNPVTAGIYGNVAACFVFEQIGVPNLEYAPEGSEKWNNIDVQERFEEYIKSFTILEDLV